MGNNQIDNLQLSASATDSAIHINADVQNMIMGNSIALYKTNITASVADNTINYALNIKDKTERARYNVKGTLQQEDKGIYRFSLKPEDLLLNYKQWTAPADNKIVLSDKSLHAEHFELSQNNQRLSINSASTESNAPVEISLPQLQHSNAHRLHTTRLHVSRRHTERQYYGE